MLTITNCRLHPESTSTSDIHCDAQTITVVLGRNQSGKTALCRLIAGLPSSATGDLSIRTEKSQRRGGAAAMVFQAFVNYPNWNVAQNIASPMLAKGVDDDDRVRELAALVKIDHLLDRMPQELSGGQQQRLAIARALAKDPAVLVMDEAFVNIDFKLREALNTELQALVNQTGVALIFTTSEPRDALAIADKLLLLEHHEVVQQGLPLDLYRNPRNVSAANLLADPAVNRISHEQYVRPEHISLAAGELTATGNQFSSTIRAVETNGAETYLHADVAVGTGVEEWVVKLPGMTTAASGDEVKLVVDTRDVLEFGS